MAAGDWENVLQTLIDKYVFQFGFDSVVKRIDKMRDDFGLKISLDERIPLALEVAELVRNLFVHNGGRVNEEFIHKTRALNLRMENETLPSHEWIHLVFVSKDVDRGKDGIQLGDRLFCDEMIADGVTKYAEIIGGELFAAISIKFYGKSEAELSGVTRQG